MHGHKVCAFFGHRRISECDKALDKIGRAVRYLIEKHEVDIFLFGSKSEFNNLCHDAVSELKKIYPHIVRVGYACLGESFVLEKERERWERMCCNISGAYCAANAVDDECEYDNKYTAGRAGYVERNRAMIDRSDYCIFYYDSQYRPPARKSCKRARGAYIPNSGTHIAYDYALLKRKKIINLFDGSHVNCEL